MADYNLTAHGRMLTHEARISAYVRAIRAAVRPGDVVLELGTGTGLMALIACQCGARRVYALEPSDTIVIAQQVARDNGFADRIEFIRAFSTAVGLPERCDVLLSDLRGSTPCFATHLADLIDARERLVKPHARWICQADMFYAAVINVPDASEQIATPWDGSRWGLNLSSALRYASNQMVLHRAAPRDLLAPARSWAHIDYPALSTPHVRGATSFMVEREALAHGLTIWFEAELFGGAKFSNAPGQPPGVYSHILLPWPEAVALRPGDRVDVQIDAVFSGRAYCWNWATTIRRDGEAAPLATFKQSTFQGLLLDRAAIMANAATFAPALSGKGEEARFLLERMDGRTTQAALAAALRAKFPARFPSDDSAIARVSQIRRMFAE